MHEIYFGVFWPGGDRKVREVRQGVWPPFALLRTPLFVTFVLIKR